MVHISAWRVDFAVVCRLPCTQLMSAAWLASAARLQEYMHVAAAFMSVISSVKANPCHLFPLLPAFPAGLPSLS
jgi:hypothetical protein